MFYSRAKYAQHTAHPTPHTHTQRERERERASMHVPLDAQDSNERPSASTLRDHPWLEKGE